MCTCIYKSVGLLIKSCDNIHGMTYITEIVLSCIVIKTLDISIIQMANYYLTL